MDARFALARRELISLAGALALGTSVVGWAQDAPPEPRSAEPSEPSVAPPPPSAELVRHRCRLFPTELDAMVDTWDRATDLGLAFQLTNIARDIVEDAQIGRCYLPSTWLAEAGIARAELADPLHRPALAGLARRLVDMADPYYRSARRGLPALPLRSAWAVATARSVYREIGVQVREQGAHAWDARISTSRLDKLRLLCQASAVTLTSRSETSEPRPPELWTRPR